MGGTLCETTVKECCRRIVAAGTPVVTTEAAALLTGASERTVYNHSSHTGLLNIAELYRICEYKKRWEHLELLAKYLPAKWPDIRPPESEDPEGGVVCVTDADVALARHIGSVLETAFVYRFFPTDKLLPLFESYATEQSIFVYRPPAKSASDCVFGDWIRYSEFRLPHISDMRTNYHRFVGLTQTRYPDDFHGEFCTRRAAMYMLEKNMVRHRAEKTKNDELLRCIATKPEEQVDVADMRVLQDDTVLSRVKIVMSFIRSLSVVQRYNDDNVIAFLTALHQYCDNNKRN